MTNDTCVKWLAKTTNREVSAVRQWEVETATQVIANKIERYGLVMRSVGVEFNTLAMLMTQSGPSDVRIHPEDNWFVPHLKLEQFEEGEAESRIRQYLTKLGIFYFIWESCYNH